MLSSYMDLPSSPAEKRISPRESDTELGTLKQTCQPLSTNAMYTTPMAMECTTVDGGNPALVDMEKLPLFAGFYTSQVVQDFFHQPYHPQLVGISAIN